MTKRSGKSTSPNKKQRPANEGSSLTLARVYIQSGAYQDAATHARKALREESCDHTEAALLLADALRLTGRRREAGQMLNQLNMPEDEHLASEFNLLSARLLAEDGKYQECVERYSVDTAKSAPGRPDVLLVSVLAGCLARLNNLENSREYVEWTIAQADRLIWPEGVADGLMSLALLDRMGGKWSRADGLLLKARESYSRLGLSRKYVVATINLGLQRLWLGHLTFADDALREAVRLAVEIADIRLEATARTDRGLALVRLNRMNEARQELAKALRLCRKQASPRRLAIALEYTGELHIASKDYFRASASLRRALEIANRIAPEGDIVPEVRRRQAEVALGLENPKDALAIAKDADDRATRLGDRYERATALRVQGEALLELDDEEEATLTFRKALEILEQLGETFERDRILLLLGEDVEDEDEESPGEPSSERKPSPAHAQTHPMLASDICRLLRKHGIIGSSLPLIEIMRQMIRVAPLGIPVLIQGETGTGKELIARAIHKMGRNPRDPLVAFNCTTCPPSLLDAELFGHKRGAFTGANANRLGLVRSAEGGTLFLDEIGEMQEESQARLLRLLDSGEVRPLGSDQLISVNVRIVAATHANLEDRIEAKRFRRDLYYRLAGIRLELPPLRKRPEDLRELIAHFIQEARIQIRPGFGGLAEHVLANMERYAWPGNVRQLRNEIFRIAALAPEGMRIDDWIPADDDQSPHTSLEPTEARFVAENPGRLRQFLYEYKGGVSEAAAALGVSRGHLYRLLKRHQISPDEFRQDDRDLSR